MSPLKNIVPGKVLSSLPLRLENNRDSFSHFLSNDSWVPAHVKYLWAVHVKTQLTRKIMSYVGLRQHHVTYFKILPQFFEVNITISINVNNNLLILNNLPQTATMKCHKI